MTRSFKFIIFFFLSVGSVAAVQAEPQTPSKNSFHKAIQHIKTHAQFYVGVQAGYSNTDFGKSQLANLNVPIPYTFTQKGESVDNPSYALNVGITIPTQDHFDYQLGVQLYRMGTHNVNGQVFLLPSKPADYDYRYNLNAQALFTQAQIDYDLPLGFSVFGRVGLGLSEVKAHDFSTTPRYRGPDAFGMSSKSSRNFAYMFGLGGAYQIPKIPVSVQLGYSIYHLADSAPLGQSTNPTQTGDGKVGTRAIEPSEFWLAFNYHFA